MAGCIHSMLVLIKINVIIDKKKIHTRQGKYGKKKPYCVICINCKKTVRKPSERESFDQELVRKDSEQTGLDSEQVRLDSEKVRLDSDQLRLDSK